MNFDLCGALVVWARSDRIDRDKTGSQLEVSDPCVQDTSLSRVLPTLFIGGLSPLAFQFSRFLIIWSDAFLVGNIVQR